VYGESETTEYAGIGGYFKGGNTGVSGVVLTSEGNDRRGVSGYVSGGTGLNSGVLDAAAGGSTDIGVYGISTAGSAPTDYAGFFDGDVEITGTLIGGGAAASKIDHPLDPSGMYFTQPYVASAEMMSVLNGNVLLGGGASAWVELPNWFESITADHRYQLTCIGGFAPVYVAEKIAANRFLIDGGEAGMEVSWQVTGIRQDRYAREHPVTVEQAKSGDALGKYVHPELYGAPAEDAIGRFGVKDERGN
jgi:hypothetical protein